jgi:hypothetical protein
MPDWDYEIIVQLRDENNKISSEMGRATNTLDGRTGVIGYAGPKPWFGPNGQQHRTCMAAVSSINRP